MLPPVRNLKIVRPILMRSPSRMTYSSMGSSLTYVPFVEPRSRMRIDLPVLTIFVWLREIDS